MTQHATQCARKCDAPLGFFAGILHEPVVPLLHFRAPEGFPNRCGGVSWS